MRFRATTGRTPRRPAAGVIDRDPQHIALGVGDLAAVHDGGRRRTTASALVRWGVPLSTVLGAAGLVVGASLSLTHPEVAVFRVGDTVHVGPAVLTASAADPDVFIGAAALVLRPQADGSIRSSSSAELGGRHATGSCVMRAVAGDELEEACQFHVGAARLTAVDRFQPRDGSRWHRRYDDGQTLIIPVPSQGAVVPVPFAIGR